MNVPAPRLIVLAAATVLAVATTSCGHGDRATAGERDPYAVAQAIIDRDQAAAPAGVTPAEPNQLAATDCRLTTTADEYGFESEELICADPPPVGAPDSVGGSKPTVVDLNALDGHLDPAHFLDLAALVPEAALVERFVELDRYLRVVEHHCGRDAGRWEEALAAYADAAETVAGELAAATAILDGFVGSLEAKVLARALVERAIMGSGCSQPGAPIRSRAAVSDDTLVTTADAAAATVAIDNTLRASAYGPLFHLYSTLPNYVWMRSETTAIDVALLGTSQLGAGIDVGLLNDQLESEVGSAWLPGALPEVQQLWIPEVEAYTGAETYVWFIGPLDLFVDCDTTARGAEYRRLAEARAAAFGPGGFVAAATPIERILGPAQPAETVRGDHEKRPGIDVEGLAVHREQYLPGFQQGRFCRERAAIVADTVAGLTARGRRVILVGMPVHPELRGVRPADADSMSALVDLLPAGVAFIDLTGAVDDPGQWSDLTHMTATGADSYTRLVAEELVTVGVG